MPFKNTCGLRFILFSNEWIIGNHLCAFYHKVILVFELIILCLFFMIRVTLTVMLTKIEFTVLTGYALRNHTGEQ